MGKGLAGRIAGLAAGKLMTVRNRRNIVSTVEFIVASASIIESMDPGYHRPKSWSQSGML